MHQAMGRRGRCGALTRRRGESAQSDWRPGFTITELLVTISVVSLLAAVLLPAVQQAREAGRRVQCTNTLRQIGVALQNFEQQHRHFPGLPWTLEILPQLGQQPLYDEVQRDHEAGAARAYTIRLYLCTSDSAVEGNFTNYCGNYSSEPIRYGSDGFFYVGYKPGRRQPSQLSAADIRDGLSQTAAVSEILRSNWDDHRLRTTWQIPFDPRGPGDAEAFAELVESLPKTPAGFGYIGGDDRGVPWVLETPRNMYNHVLPPNRPNATPYGWAQLGCYPAGSMHPGGANTLYADGHVVFTSQEIDRFAWREAGSRGPQTWD